MLMIVKELSKFIVDLNYQNIPKTAIKQAKLCFLDFLGVTNRGFYEESTQIAMKTIKSMALSEEGGYDRINKKSSIIGGGYSSMANAGFINGISAHSLDLDDGHRVAQLHPGGVVFPSAVAIAEANNIDGWKFLESVVCGYEVAIVLGILANPYHRNQGFHSTGTIGTFASCAVASKLLNLSLEETINAFGICGTQSSGFLEVDHQATMGKQLHSGKAVYNGILSTYLAKNGFTGPESIIDGDEGFLKSMVTEKFGHMDLNTFDNYIKSFLNEYIGKFHINNVYLKKYPFCRHIHSSIDATLNINNKFDFDIGDIDKIIIKTYKIAAEHDNFNPKNKEEIKQSLPYAVALAIVENRLDLDLFENILNNNIFNNINTNNISNNNFNNNK
jgi:2-methylcitrate dehydratase PrpD